MEALKQREEKNLTGTILAQQEAQIGLRFVYISFFEIF
jgi:hypothetical protein